MHIIGTKFVHSPASIYGYEFRWIGGVGEQSS